MIVYANEEISFFCVHFTHIVYFLHKKSRILALLITAYCITHVLIESLESVFEKLFLALLPCYFDQFGTVFAYIRWKDADPLSCIFLLPAGRKSCNIP